MDSLEFSLSPTQLSDVVDVVDALAVWNDVSELYSEKSSSSSSKTSNSKPTFGLLYL